MRKLFLLFVLGAVTASHAQAQLPAKVGYADVAYIMAQMPETKEMQAKLKDTQASLAGELSTKQQQFQKQYADYTANANAMTDTARANAEKKLQQLSGEIRQFQEDAQNTLENTQKLYMAPLYLKVGKAIDEVAMEKGFAMIISLKISDVNFLLYADEKMDVSDLVLQKLGVTPDPSLKK